MAMIRMRTSQNRIDGLIPFRAVWMVSSALMLVCGGCIFVRTNIQHTSASKEKPSEPEESKQEAETDDEESSTVHVCSRQCADHYYDGKQIVTIDGHKHQPSCGHAWDGEHWVAVMIAQRSGPTAHACTAECEDHYREGDRITTIYQHKHKPGCGHLFDGRDWLRVATENSTE